MKKIDLSFALVCSRAIHDEPTKMWSFIDVFTYYTLPDGLDFGFQSFAVAARLNNVSIGEHAITVNLISPSGKKIGEVDLSGVVQNDSGHLSLTAFFNEIKLNETGKHYYKITVDGVELTRKNLHYYEVNKPSKI